LKDERQAGSIVRGNSKAAPDIRQSGPAAGSGYVLRGRHKVKARDRRQNRNTSVGFEKKIHVS
jgi:hypothetical protein